MRFAFAPRSPCPSRDLLRRSITLPAPSGRTRTTTSSTNWKIAVVDLASKVPPAASSAVPAPAERRRVWYDADTPVETPVYDRRALVPGVGLSGPAVIEELDATTVLFPGDSLEVDGAGSMVIKLGTAA